MLTRKSHIRGAFRQFIINCQWSLFIIRLAVMRSPKRKATQTKVRG